MEDGCLLRCESDGRDDQHVEHKVDIGLVEHRELILRVGDTLLPDGKVVKHEEEEEEKEIDTSKFHEDLLL